MAQAIHAARFCFSYPVVFGFFMSANLSAAGTLTRDTTVQLKPPADADSLYIERYAKGNDVRLFYGGQGSSIAYGSSRKDNGTVNTSLYNNVNDLLGLGLTYKFIDFNLSYSLPSVRILHEDRQNLSQFRLSSRYTGRRFAVRGTFSNSKGVIVTDQGGDFTSAPDVHVFRVGIQLTVYFNYRRYSFRAANFQNELQRKSAGSLLLELEPFYRSLGIKTPLVPQALDVPETYGQQVGLSYVRSPGVLSGFGYGYNFALFGGKCFVSPIVLAGPGLAFNVYKAESGNYTTPRVEWARSFALNLGYNGRKAYATLRGAYDASYFRLNPSYFTTTNLKITLTLGLRFYNLENRIPSAIF